MTDRSHETLAPHRALLHPAWLAGLVLLVLNDHLLKQSGLLPGFVTGKLSDFAGLFIAPALLAALVMARTRFGLALAHVAVGAGFGAIQLSPTLADAWSRAMAAFGFRWSIVSDPSDLFALATLAASWLVLTPAMSARATHNLRRTAEATVGTVGLLCCVATSPAVDPNELWFEEIEAAVYLNNASDEEIVVRLRELRPDVLVDCELVGSDPGAVLSAPLFLSAQTWTMPPRTNIAAWGQARDRECYAVLVEADGLPTAVLFWSEDDPSVDFHDGATDANGSHDEGAVLIVPPGEEVVAGYDDLGAGLVFELDPPLADQLDSQCTPLGDGGRLAWSAPAPTGTAEIMAVDVGPDGCLGIDLAPDGLPEETVGERWYLCMPFAMFPFEPGEHIEIVDLRDDAASADGLLLRRIDPETSMASEQPLELTLSRGGGLVPLHDLESTLRPEPECPTVPNGDCGTATRRAQLKVSSEELGLAETLEVADTRVVDLSTGASIELHLVHAEDRPVLHSMCSEGADTVGPDIELAAILRGGETP